MLIRFFILTALLLLSSAMLCVRGEEPKHPGEKQNCSLRLSETCTEWTAPASIAALGLSGKEIWREIESSSNGSVKTVDSHEFVTFSPDHAVTRWAIEMTTVVNPTSAREQTHHSYLEYQVGEIEYEETCDTYTSPHIIRTKREFEEYRGLTHLNGYIFGNENTDGTPHNLGSRWDISKRAYVPDPAVSDTTHCTVKDFPWSLVRDPNLKPR